MLKAYCVSFGGDYVVLAWAESHTKARSLCVGHYTGSKEDESYMSLTARRLPHMDGHPHTPAIPCVMDGYGSLPHENDLVRLSFVHRCRNCGAEYEDEWPPCECTGGSEAYDSEIKEAYAGLHWNSQAQLGRKGACIN